MGYCEDALDVMSGGFGKSYHFRLDNFFSIDITYDFYQGFATRARHFANLLQRSDFLTFEQLFNGLRCHIRHFEYETT